MSALVDLFKGGSEGTKPKVCLGGFGKLAALSEHKSAPWGELQQRGLEIQQKLYHEVITKKLDTWGSEKAELKCPLDHWLVWIAPQSLLLGRVLASSDLGNRRSVLVIVAELQRCILGYALRKIAVELEGFSQRVLKNPSPDSVRASFITQQGILQSMLDTSQISETEDWTPNAEERQTFISKIGFDVSIDPLARILYRAKSKWQPFAAVRGKAPRLKDENAELRVPAWPESMAASVMLWDEVFTTLIHPEVPRMYIVPANQNWLDVAVGNLNASNFENLSKNSKAVVPEGGGGDPISPELKSVVSGMLQSLRHGAISPSRAAELSLPIETPPSESETGARIPPPGDLTSSVGNPFDRPKNPLPTTENPQPVTEPSQGAAIPQKIKTGKHRGNGPMIGVVSAIFVVVALILGLVLVPSKPTLNIAKVEVQKKNQGDNLISNLVNGSSPKDNENHANVLESKSGVGATTNPATTSSNKFPLPTAAFLQDYTVCKGATAHVTLRMTGTGPWKVTWLDGLVQSSKTAECERLVSPIESTNYDIVFISDSNYPDGITLKNVSVKVTVDPPLAVSARAAPPNVMEGNSITLTAAAMGGTPPYSYSWNPKAGLDQPETEHVLAQAVKAGDLNYTVTVTDSLGCIAENHVLTVVKKRPEVSLRLSGGGNVCPGDSVNIEIKLTGQSPWKVEWSDGVAETINSSNYLRKIITTTNTEYYLTSLSDSNGTTIDMEQLRNDSAKIVVYQRPTSRIQVEDRIITQGEAARVSVELKGTPPWDVEWSDSSTERITNSSWAHMFHPVSNTVYKIVSLKDEYCVSKEEDLKGQVQIVVMPPKKSIDALSNLKSSARNSSNGGSETNRTNVLKPEADKRDILSNLDIVAKCDSELKSMLNAFGVRSSKIKSSAVQSAPDLPPYKPNAYEDEDKWQEWVNERIRKYQEKNVYDAARQADLDKLLDAVALNNSRAE